MGSETSYMYLNILFLSFDEEQEKFMYTEDFEWRIFRKFRLSY